MGMGTVDFLGLTPDRE